MKDYLRCSCFLFIFSQLYLSQCLPLDSAVERRNFISNLQSVRRKSGTKLLQKTLSSAAITSFIDVFSANRKNSEEKPTRLKRSPNGLDFAEENSELNFDMRDSGRLGTQPDPYYPVGPNADLPLNTGLDFGNENSNMEFETTDSERLGENPEIRSDQNPSLNLPPSAVAPTVVNLPRRNTFAKNHSSSDPEVTRPNLPIHDTPKYMLDLFARFENDPFSQPASNIVRSFFNEATVEDQLLYGNAYQACIEGREFDDCPRVHHLMFDVTSVPDHEHVTMAELRLYKIVERDRRRYTGVNRKVEVVEIIRSVAGDPDANDTRASAKRVVLDSRRIIGRSSGWETFFITQAIRRWVRGGAQVVHELEVYIENILGGSEDTTLEFEQTSNSTNEPLLVVFSDDTSKRHRLEHREELQDLLSHGMDQDVVSSPIGIPSFPPLEPLSEGGHEQAILNRKKRSPFGLCHLERMYVNFRAIGYHSWIISPKGYPAGHCVGSCDFPFRHVTPHGIIQYLMHRHYRSQYHKPCCVPTKLGPISLLYYEKNSLTYKYNYEGLQVLECGCK